MAGNCAAAAPDGGNKCGKRCTIYCKALVGPIGLTCMSKTQPKPAGMGVMGALTQQGCEQVCALLPPLSGGTGAALDKNANSAQCRLNRIVMAQRYLTHSTARTRMLTTHTPPRTCTYIHAHARTQTHVHARKRTHKQTHKQTFSEWIIATGGFAVHHSYVCASAAWRRSCPSRTGRGVCNQPSKRRAAARASTAARCAATRVRRTAQS